jgi:hypothetical protein
VFLILKISSTLMMLRIITPYQVCFLHPTLKGAQGFLDGIREIAKYG